MELAYSPGARPNPYSFERIGGTSSWSRSFGVDVEPSWSTSSRVREGTTWDDEQEAMPIYRCRQCDVDSALGVGLGGASPHGRSKHWDR